MNMMDMMNSGYYLGDDEDKDKENEDQRTFFRRRMEEIDLMPENTPEQKAAKQDAIRVLTQDYEGMRENLGEDLALANEFMTTETPQGRQVGQIYVAASPLQHLARVLRMGYGAYERKKAKDKLDLLSKEKQQGIGGLWRAGSAGSGQRGRSPLSSALRGGAKPFDLSMGLGTDVPEMMQSGQMKHVPAQRAGVAPARDLDTQEVNIGEEPPMVDSRPRGRGASGSWGDPAPPARRERGASGTWGTPTPNNPKRPVVHELRGGVPPYSDRRMGTSTYNGRFPTPLGSPAGAKPSPASGNRPAAPSRPVSMSPDRKSILDELMSRMNYRGY